MNFGARTELAFHDYRRLLREIETEDSPGGGTSEAGGLTDQARAMRGVPGERQDLAEVRDESAVAGRYQGAVPRLGIQYYRRERAG